MISTSVSRRMPTHKFRKNKSRKQSPRPNAYTPIPTMPPISTSSSSTAVADIKKPMRPLTAYHIFFQIEREYIIQTTAGPDADKSIHDNKCYLPNVPRRYRCIKLLSDWFAGPGKRKKRKHRKSHGKVGFLELSQLISKRWKNLSTTDPETKHFVSKIAAGELAEYKVEMQNYKMLTAMSTVPAKKIAEPVVSTVVADTSSAMISPSASPRSSPGPSSFPSAFMSFTRYCMPVGVYAELIQSMDQESTVESSSSDEDEVDYSICSVSNNGNYIPSPGPAFVHSDDSICDPLFELEDDYNDVQQTSTKRCVSPASSNTSANVLADEHLLHLLSC